MGARTMQKCLKGFYIAAILMLISDGIAFGQWRTQTIKSDADFRGLCVVSAEVAWIGGTKGTYGRTSDGGDTWTAGNVADAEKLDFRAVKAFDANTAYLMSAGRSEE